MAKRDEQQRKLDLLDQLSKRRDQITSQKSRLATQVAQTKVQLKDKVNVPKMINTKIKSSFSNSPTKWFIGSAVGGLLISKVLFGRGKTNKKKSSSTSQKEEKYSTKVPRGLLMSAAFFFGKPMLKSYAIRRAKEYVAHKYLLGNR